MTCPLPLAHFSRHAQLCVPRVKKSPAFCFRAKRSTQYQTIELRRRRRRSQLNRSVSTGRVRRPWDRKRWEFQRRSCATAASDPSRTGSYCESWIGHGTNAAYSAASVCRLLTDRATSRTLSSTANQTTNGPYCLTPSLYTGWQWRHSTVYTISTAVMLKVYRVATVYNVVLYSRVCLQTVAYVESYISFEVKVCEKLWHDIVKLPHFNSLFVDIRCTSNVAAWCYAQFNYVTFPQVYLTVIAGAFCLAETKQFRDCFETVLFQFHFVVRIVLWLDARYSIPYWEVTHMTLSCRAVLLNVILYSLLFTTVVAKPRNKQC